MTVKADLIAAMKAYADAGGDLDFEEGWGSTGRKLEIRNETVDTGAMWLNDPNMAEGMFQAIAEVLGDNQVEDIDAVVAPSITLTKTPSSAATLMVFFAGVLLRRVTSPTLSTEYSLSGKTITFGTSKTGWVHARYLASS